ncbi:Peroxidase 51 [Ananas comosus]|uniref:Peroxidase n=1 Tax=Ananas comosus TaxID=4615 RepID=A0A199W9C9_ANACO|nr:Peroxidase 51 [Ananas comosus]
MELMIRRSLFMMLVLSTIVRGGEAKLWPNFYRSTCPNVEEIVRGAVTKKISQTVVTIPATLRLFFHDCFVEDAPDNLSLAGDGFDTVIKAKAAVEAQCPGVLGRRDGLVSLASRVAGKLPGPDFNLDSLTTLFGKNNLTLFDMITLSGAHTVGFAHCSRFTNRLYRFGSSSSVDPTINPDYARELMQACPANVGPTIAVNMDPVTPITFDNVYYANLAAGLGLFTSDEVLYADGRSQPVVKGFAGDQSSFFAAFAKSMVKLGRVGVKTGRRGQIRRDCTAFN